MEQDQGVAVHRNRRLVAAALGLPVFDLFTND